MRAHTHHTTAWGEGGSSAPRLSAHTLVPPPPCITTIRNCLKTIADVLYSGIPHSRDKTVILMDSNDHLEGIEIFFRNGKQRCMCLVKDVGVTYNVIDAAPRLGQSRYLSHNGLISHCHPKKVTPNPIAVSLVTFQEKI